MKEKKPIVLILLLSLGLWALICGLVLTIHELFSFLL